MDNGFIFKKINKNENIKTKKKKSCEPFRSYLLNSTANPAHFHSNWLVWTHIISELDGVSLNFSVTDSTDIKQGYLLIS